MGLVFVSYPSPKVPTGEIIFYRPMKFFKKPVAHMYSQMFCLNTWDAFHNPAERTAPPGVDAAETVRFSWKVVEPQGQREHDVRVSR